MSKRTASRPNISRQNSTRLCSGTVVVENRRGAKFRSPDGIWQVLFDVKLVAFQLTDVDSRDGNNSQRRSPPSTTGLISSGYAVRPPARSAWPMRADQ